METLTAEKLSMKSHKDKVVEELLTEKNQAIERLQKDKELLFDTLHTEHKTA